MAKFNKTGGKPKYVLTLSKKEVEALGALVLNVQDDDEPIEGPIWRVFHVLYKANIDMSKYAIYEDSESETEISPVLRKENK